MSDLAADRWQDPTTATAAIKQIMSARDAA
jgi:hypothetical protein